MAGIRDGLLRAANRILGGPPAFVPAAPVRQSIDQFISIAKASYAASIGAPSAQMSEEQARAYYHDWQYAAASVVAEAIMQIPWTVEVKSAGAWEEDPEHPLAALLTRVNPLMGPRMLWLLAGLDLMIVGRAPWRIVFNSLNEPWELYPLIGRLDAVFDSKGAQTAWVRKYRDAGPTGSGATEREERLDVGDVVPLRFPMPGTLMDSFSPMRAAGAPVRMADQITESEWSAMRQGVWPSLILEMNTRDPETAARMLDEFNAKYAGTKETGRAMGIRSEVSKIHWPPTNPREMGYTQSGQRNVDAILGIMRVPAAILGQSKDVNRASAEALRYIFAQWNIAPKAVLLEEQIQHHLAERHYGEDVRFRFLEVVPKDEEAGRLRDDMELKNYVITVNEYRESIGRPAVPWGDVPLLPLGVAPLGSPAPEPGAGGEQAAARPTVLAAEAPAAKPAARPVRERRPAPFSERKGRAVALRFVHAKAGTAAEVKEVTAAFFEDVGRRVLAAWDEAKPKQGGAARVTQALAVPLDRVLDAQSMAAELARRMAPVVRGGIVFGGSFDRALTPDPKKYGWNATMRAVDQAAAKFGQEHFGEVAMTTRVRYTEVVAESIRAQETWDETRARIVDAIGSMKESRAANIATTESTKLFNAGAQAFRDSAGIEWKQWVTSFINSRDTHIAANGQVVRNGEEFQVGADRMQNPGEGDLAEENCNCNCVSVAAFPESK